VKYRAWVFDVGYSVLDILKKDPRNRFNIARSAAFMMRECKHQTLNIKYPTPKARLTETWVFDVGYSVLDILKKDSRNRFNIARSAGLHDARMQTSNTQYQIFNTKS
jgi:hypothetical protein